MIKSKTYIAIPPGTTIKEYLDDCGMNQTEFAHRMDMPEKHISKLIDGEVFVFQAASSQRPEADELTVGPMAQEGHPREQELRT